MSVITVFLLALALGADAFSVCLGIGMTRLKRAQVLLISVTVLIFHILMPLIGWYVGQLAGNLVGRAASIVGALVLIFLGGKMLWDIFRAGPEKPKVALLNTWGLMVLAISVSLDALSVGFTLGTQAANLVLTVVVFGLVAGLMSFLGLLLGKTLGSWIGEKAHWVGGIILVGIGVKLLM